jgi:hypothetical protein
VADLLSLEVDLVYFDTTCTYFELDLPSDKGEPLRRYGHSKDHRPDRPQTVIGLAVTRTGIPIRCWVWPGNTDKDRGHLCLARAGEGPRSGSDPRGPARPREQPDRPSFDAVWAEQSDDVLDYWRKLNSRTQKDIISLTLADSAMVVRTIGSCESVLEQVLAAHLLTVARTMSLVQDFTLEPQHEVETPAGQFRIDLLARGLVNGCLLCLAVECDGHAYHDRTKEQAGPVGALWNRGDGSAAGQADGTGPRGSPRRPHATPTYQ